MRGGVDHRDGFAARGSGPKHGWAVVTNQFRTGECEPLLSFKRAFVAFREGACDITVERSLFGYSLYSRASYRVAVNEGKIAASNNGGWIGRLPIYPQIMQFADIIFADLWSALDRERKLVAKMAGMELHDGSVTLITPSL